MLLRHSYTGFLHVRARSNQIIFPCTSRLVNSTPAAPVPSLLFFSCSLTSAHSASVIRSTLHLAFFLLSGGTELNSGPANFTVCTFIIRSILHPFHSAALSDLIDRRSVMSWRDLRSTLRDFRQQILQNHSLTSPDCLQYHRILSTRQIRSSRCQTLQASVSIKPMVYSHLQRLSIDPPSC